MYDQDKIRKKSIILTNHTNLKTHSSSVPSLPSIESLPKGKQSPSKTFKVYSIKTREELLKQDRFRNLLKLKINLNDLHIQEIQFQERMKPKKQRDANMAERMEVRLNQIMAIETQPTSQTKMERNLEEIQFGHYCENLLKTCSIIRKQGNMHFKNKIVNFTYSMKNQAELLNLFQKLLNDIPIPKLYKMYKKSFQETPYFKRQLAALAIQSKHIVETYQKSRYKFLNADIERRKIQMAAQGNQIGNKLNFVQNWKIRKRLFGSLQNMQFQCMANRNFYQQLTERVKSIDM